MSSAEIWVAGMPLDKEKEGKIAEVSLVCLIQPTDSSVFVKRACDPP